MVTDMVGMAYFAVVAGVAGGLILRFAQVVAKKISPENEKWWLEAIIAIAVLIIYGIYLAIVSG